MFMIGKRCTCTRTYGGGLTLNSLEPHVRISSRYCLLKVLILYDRYYNLIGGTIYRSV
jgi:hypothetical protein